jgi:hypothetical protein
MTIIKELIEKASNTVKHTVPKPENIFREGMLMRHEIDTELLVKLTIKECINTLSLNGYDDAMESIKKHFGVEE